ncbi:hypothetical protein NEDG_00085 [Nematocida displodere]|uniref:Uncharacterized protein n=1 Tax=Nematocida displodere TaxID=1805483 RepID=A0A177EJQ5_9MICR|nr:hypothetical protein NEDG_00085 [Nematocida displodere]
MRLLKSLGMMLALGKGLSVMAKTPTSSGSAEYTASRTGGYEDSEGSVQYNDGQSSGKNTTQPENANTLANRLRLKKILRITLYTAENKDLPHFLRQYGPNGQREIFQQAINLLRNTKSSDKTNYTTESGGSSSQSSSSSSSNTKGTKTITTTTTSGGEVDRSYEE